MRTQTTKQQNNKNKHNQEQKKIKRTQHTNKQRIRNNTIRK